MQIVEIGKNKISFYQSIKELPVSLYNQMQSFLLQDAGIGSTMQDIEKHFNNLDAFLMAGKLEEAKTERLNLQLAFYSNIEKINYKSLAFSCLIHSINGIELKDRSEEGLKVLVDELSKSGLVIGFIEETIENIKKNCITN